MHMIVPWSKQTIISISNSNEGRRQVNTRYKIADYRKYTSLKKFKMDSRKTPYFIFYSNYALETETLCPADLSQFCNSTIFFFFFHYRFISL